MKFAIINDMHAGPPESGFFRGVQRKLVQKSEALTKAFIEEMNTHEHPQFVINLGDSIEDVNHKETDTKFLRQTLSLLSNLDMPIYHAVGNHDVRTLSQQEIAEIVGYEKMYYSFDEGDIHFVVLSFEMTGNHTKVQNDITAQIPDKQIDWLKKDLQNTDKPTVVFSHYGLADDDMKGNFWFEPNPHHALISNRAEVREIFEQSKKVKAVISAHQHWNRRFVHNGIPYFTVTSLVENFNNDGIASEAYSIVHIEEGKITVDVKGNDPAKFEFEF